MIPALVITGPVADRARSVPSRVPCRRASSRTLELIGDRIWWPSTAGKGGVLREEIDEPEPEPART
ncbi:MAG TPA: hypothetical protein VFO85_22500 [Vicinamibacteria bacterium]|nr:hypothetical protein [Vicinamibacteria bacterium]